MKPLEVHGSPKEFDAFLRPPLRILQLSLGLSGTALLGCLGWWWWAPVPLALSFLVYEWFFYARADKPLAIGLSHDALTISDPFLDKRRVVDLGPVHSATLAYRAAGPDRVEAVLVLADRSAVLIGLQLRLAPGAFLPSEHDVDIDLCNAVLGSISGLARALVPRDSLVRQPVEDPAVIDWLRARLDPQVWERTAVRSWRGEQPDLDLFGYHQGPADGLIRVDEHGLWFDEDGPHPLEPVPPSRSERIAVLFRMEGEEHEERSELLPLWIQPMGPRTVAIPAPLVEPDLPELPLRSDLLHVHAPEGALLLWALWRRIPAERWPSAWTDALRNARPAVQHWPAAIPEPD